MQIRNNALLTLRALKSVPLTILMALFLKQSPATQQWLVTTLGYSKKTVSNALSFLTSSGYVERVGYRQWRLHNGQLPLPGFGPPALPSGRGENREGAKNTLSKPEGVKNTLSPPTTTTTEIVEVEIEKKVVVVSKEPEGVKNTLSNPEGVENTPSAEHVKAFREAGIGRQLWPELAALPHVTPDYIRAHTTARQAGVGQYQELAKRNVGFQIHCMRFGDPAPDFCQECGGLDGHHQSKCRKRYTTGKYAHQIQH